MSVNCKLCGKPLSRSAGRSRCQCGWRLDTNCREAHDGWCPVRGDDPWIGAQEF